MGKTDYAGIDYSGPGSVVNMDPNTAIRYGVIPANEVGQYWYEESEANYYYACPECGKEFGFEFPDMDKCPDCGHEFDDYTWDMLEPYSFSYEGDGYAMEQGGDDADIFVMDSPFFTYAQFCSPCAPGACYLLNWLEEPSENNRAYCLGHDWFEGGIAPYPVYDFKTGKEVKPSET